MSERIQAYRKYLYRIVDVFPTDKDCGIEIELEGNYLPHRLPSPQWLVKGDGSLRDGVEYITAGPIPITEVIPAVKDLVQAFNNAQSYVAMNSYRTSTHIHINYTKKTLKTIVRTCILFALIEPFFLRLCGPDRDGNLFCLPTFETGDMAYFLRQLILYAERPTIFHIWKRGRYSSLNTSSLFTFGSLEYRCFPKSIDPDQIHRWCEILLKLRSVAENGESSSCYNEIDDFRHDPRELLTNVFGRMSFEGLLGPTRMNDLAQIGIENAHELSIGVITAESILSGINNNIRMNPPGVTPEPDDLVDLDDLL